MASNQSANARAGNASVAPMNASQTEEQNNSEENQKEKNPTITNPHWENADGQAITKALVGDEVYLCADVTDIDDGATAKIKIVEKDDDGNDDEVTTLPAKVQDGKIRCDWKVVYTEDNDDTESQKEMEEKGYTLPEYVFRIECDGAESEESGQLNLKSGIRFLLQNKQNGKLLKNLPFLILKNEKIIYKSKTDENGYAELLDLEIGAYYIITGKDMKKWLNKK